MKKELAERIPAGETRTYSEIAKALGKPSAYRAVARANGAYQLTIIVPCHRVINASGSSWLWWWAKKKKWILDHEKQGG